MNIEKLSGAAIGYRMLGRILSLVYLPFKQMFHLLYFVLIDMCVMQWGNLAYFVTVTKGIKNVCHIYTCNKVV